MKLIIICALAVAALAYGPVVIHGGGNHAPELGNRNPYKYLLRSRWSNKICTPGSTKKMNRADCTCSATGSEWLCNLAESLQIPPDHQAGYDRVTHPDKTKRLIRSAKDTQIKRECDRLDDVRQIDCFTCYCDSEGFYSICFSRAQCDVENLNYRTSSERTIVVHGSFNLENYEIVS